jgi:hypothetical protein
MKHWKYLSYLIRHKWFVFRAGLRNGVSVYRLLIHDWSKFLPCEWFPYVENFYGKKAWLQKNEPDDCRYWSVAQPFIDAYNEAWLHHQHFNPHHWQHWVLREDNGETKLLQMPQKFAREMVADWCGAGRAITGKWEVGSWYAKNRDGIRLHPHTRELVDLLVAVEQGELE